MYESQSWRHILLTDGARCLTWINETEARIIKLQVIADDLELYLKSVLRKRETCIAFWEAIPNIRNACNDNKTYEKPLAAEAYAYVHFLDKYWRTWDVLMELTEKGALPLGIEGIRILDIGAGPAPTAYAINDFYRLLRDFGNDESIAAFLCQETEVKVIESSPSMCHFIHHFSECTKRRGPFHAHKKDFALVDPVSERISLRKELQRMEYYDGSVNEYFDEYSPKEVNEIVQREERYRLVILSNFLTLNETVSKFEPNLRALFSDLRGGSSVIIVGGRGIQYEKIYADLMSIAKSSGLTNMTELPTTLGSTSYSTAAGIIKRCQNNIYQHLEQLTGNKSLSRTKDYPDYWNAEPSKKRRPDFRLQVFRKGRWPK
ncbi:MAG: hypothetical protein Q8M95_06925 [Candidatus Methanoperedens sp.]|nr:hypothetical protein [Candidatus Methanoperedens sp.]